MVSAAPPVRPLTERARDSAAIGGACGSMVGACLAARHEASLLGGALYFGGGWAALGVSFVALRHVILQGQFEDDREGVSGLAAGVIAITGGTARLGRKWGARLGIAAFFGGCTAHYAHRWWLHARLGSADMARTTHHFLKTGGSANGSNS